jgi:hypothetical protein
MPNPFVHVELQTTDVEAAKSFYTRLFDWQLESITGANDMDYTLVKTGQGTGGIMQQLMPGAPSAWLSYVLVEDLKASTAKARALGATILKDNLEVPGMGWLTIIIDPTGAHLGMWQPGADMGKP